jgi:DNA polymerase V
MYALMDCNNFYASCERLFRPDLATCPIVVLSNNDGCVIARSNEAKALGIAMGEPYFKIKALCQHERIAVFSSNFPLYGDLSQRVMATLEHVWPHYEIYSIDEAFLNLATLAQHEHIPLAHRLQQQILRHTGIPTSIGIGATKTLAKLANHVGKTIQKSSVCYLHPQHYLLKNIQVDEVWGVGRAYAKQLHRQGIHTVYDLAHAPLKRFHAPLQQTILELQGIDAIAYHELAPDPKSIIASRSFAVEQRQLSHLIEAVSAHCQTVYDKLRRHRLYAQHVQVFLRTNPFGPHASIPTLSQQIRLLHATDDLTTLTKTALRALQSIYQSGLSYKKAGVCLTDLHHPEREQYTLFDRVEGPCARDQRYLAAMDQINQRYGRNTLRLACSGIKPSWKKPPGLISPAYTTRWHELVRVQC